MDVFCGIGGNTIQFALNPRCKRVIALDIDPNAIWCAKRNCERYGVGGKVEFLQMSFFEWGKVGMDDRPEANVVFCSPPWGGPSYKSLKVFNVDKIEPYGFGVVWEEALKALKPCISTTYTDTNTKIAKLGFFMPRTSDLNQFAGYVDKLDPTGSGLEKGKGKGKALGATVAAKVIHYTLSGKSKGLCFYVDVPVMTSVGK